jgi:hypothetical protein
MDEIEIALEDLVRESKKRDTIAAVLISTALFLFGVLTLILLEIIVVEPIIRGIIIVGILIVTWSAMSVGIYMLVSTPIPSPPAKVVADLGGLNGLNSRRYPGKVYISPSTFRKIKPSVSLRMNIEIVEVPPEFKAEFEKYGDLAEEVAIAKLIRARYIVSDRKKGSVNGVKVVSPSEFRV